MWCFVVSLFTPHPHPPSHSVPTLFYPQVVGKDYAETGITCNALAPAVVRTAMVDAMPEEQVKYMTDKIPMKRCGTLAEIAALVAFIASPAASFTTGFTFDATGGRATY